MRAEGGKKIASSDSYLNEITQSEVPETLKIEKELFPPRKEKEPEIIRTNMEYEQIKPIEGLEGEVLSGSSEVSMQRQEEDIQPMADKNI